MKHMLYAAAALSLVLAGPAAHAQGSDQGTPNTEHGSGDMMQDGPHASAQPESASPSSLPSGRDTSRTSKLQVCHDKWQQAVSQGTTGGRQRQEFIDECMQRS
ncbi:MAG: hypothetical protein JOZ13_10225 [Alphaproteobacteria bacterium]|nr:hypothetical protein [Alphaproteobacteria bacterium]